MDANHYFRTQYGLITVEQAKAVGLSSRQMSLRVDRADWIRLRAGVFRHAGSRPSWRQRVLAETLRREAVASHRAAAALWQHDVYNHPPIEITTPGRLNAPPEVRTHVSKQWDRRDEVTRFGIPCTGIERTILDCGAVAGIGRVERLAEAAIRKELTSWAQLRHTLVSDARRGRDGCGTLRALLDDRAGDATVPLSDFSRRIVLLLTTAGLPAPVVEHPIEDDHGLHILQVDLAWPELKRAWELDGLQWHFGRADVERDRRKRNAAIAEGWVIQEVLWSMYQQSPGQLVDMARRFLSP